MITVTGLGKSYGARTLFSGVDLKLVAGSRYGLVGANGSGKTTFLQLLAGLDAPTEGGVSIQKGARVGVLRQDHYLRDEEPILEVVGIPVAQHRLPLSTLSGGFRLRVLLAQVLLGGPDVLLLDEPTNHLDILSIRWLEKFLGGYGGCAVIISHDQRFLDNVATCILDVDYETITAYPGDHAHFVAEKAATRARKEAEIARAEALVADKKAWVERFGAKATKARQAQSRLKQIEKIEIEELAATSRRAPMFAFLPVRPSGRDVLDVAAVSHAYVPEKWVLRDLSLTLRRGERLAVIGANGLGKSTLLKIAVGELAPTAGSVRWGHETKVGYFAQDHHEVLLDEDATPEKVIWDTVPDETVHFVRGQLGRLLFSGGDVHKRVGALSGGEAARLVFCRIMVQRPNVLVLDEPTNHLDLEAIEALVEALRTFDGTVLFVSHDRAFVSALATRIVEVRPDGFRDFPGTYDEYLARCGDDHLDAAAVVLRHKAEKAAEATGREQGALSWEEKKRRDNQRKQLPARRDEVVAKIERAEARKAEIQARFCAEGFFEATPQEEVAALAAEEAALGPQIDALVAEWEALEAELSRA